MNSFVAVIAIIIAYFCGTLPVAILIAKSKGIDITTFGSGNPGASNVARALGAKYGVLVFVGDALKGALPVLALLSNRPIAYACAAATVLGHVFPITRKFKGGKGVATALGILLAINWVLGLTTLSTWLIVAVFLRYSSLAALISALFAPVYFVFLFGIQPMAMAILLMSALLIWRHRSNIKNLLNGTEGRLGKKK